jgi:hypothetical protein
MPAFKRALLASLLAALTTAVIVRSYQAQPPVADSARAIYSHGVLRLTIPYLAPESSKGQLTVDILDPEDVSIGHLQKDADIGQGHGVWKEELKLDRPVALDELIWHRVRYWFVSNGDPWQPPIGGIESLTQMLRTPVVHVIGQQSYLSGGEAAVRVIVTDSDNQPIEGAGSVQIELVTHDRKSQVLYTGKLNQRGTAEAQFRFPAGLTGSYPLRYVVDTAIGSTEATQPVTLEEKAQILLTAEKPIYQPGQTIHARALALDRSTHEATANRKLIFEVEDSRGNKVFKKATQTDEFGVALADFALAGEVNLGTYHLRAAMEPKTTAELAINVDRYVLPKFRVALELAGKDNAKHGYRPGDHVTGTVRANYFFGKPVDGGEVTVKASAMDVDVFQAGAVNGKTDSDGAWHFDLQLPSYFAGRRLDKGAAQVLVEAAVKDSAGHTESRGEPITVSQQPILITAIPEGGMLIPELENQIFIVTAYPDGRPAATQIKVRGESAETDAGGAAVIHVRAGHGVETIAIEARDKAGNEARQTVNLASRTGSDQILLRAERAVYRAGDRILLHVFSTRERGAAYLDVVKEGQTVLTRDVDLHNGEAELTLTATPDLAGTVDFHAYLIGRDAQPVADHRLAFVQPADELKIEAASDSASYKPGDDARIRFRVTNSRGEGVRAAIGLQVVDEAVFALAEKQPGFAKVFFYLEQEVMKPRYEIHSIGMPEVVTTGANRDLAGRALFAATEVVNTKNFDREFGRTLPDGRYWEYRTRYWKRFDEQANKLAEHFSSTYAQDPDAGTLPQLMAKLVAAHDPLVRDSWGNDLILEHPTWMQRDEFQLRSTASWQTNGGGGLGLALLLHVNRGTVLRNARPGGTIDLGMEHDRGPFNGLAEIAGTVVDASGAVVPGVFVTAQSSTGKTMTTHADADGHFQFSTVLPGDYNLEIISLGFRAASRELALQARDRAVLSVKLEVRQITESVEVSTGGYGLGQDGSVAGGTVGGVIGGIVGAVPSGPHRPLPCGSRSAAASSSFATAPS